MIMKCMPYFSIHSFHSCVISSKLILPLQYWACGSFLDHRLDTIFSRLLPQFVEKFQMEEPIIKSDFFDVAPSGTNYTMIASFAVTRSYQRGPYIAAVHRRRCSCNQKEQFANAKSSNEASLFSLSHRH